MRALVIEDDPVSARLVGEALAAEGIVAEAAGRGEEGLELARLYDFDVVVLDVRLPDLDGCEVVRRLRAARRPVPVLMLSGRAGAADKVRAWPRARTTTSPSRSTGPSSRPGCTRWSGAPAATRRR